MDEYMALLSKYPTIYIDNRRLNKANVDARLRAIDFYAAASLELQIETCGMLRLATPDNIISALEDMGVDFEKRFRNKKVGRPSLDIQKVVNPLIESGIAVELLEAYKGFRSC